MARINRRLFIQGTAATGAAMTLAAPAIHAQEGQTLHFVPQADLSVIDPIWTTAYITRNHGYLVYDTLFGTDENSQIRPQMVDQVAVSAEGMKYTFTLRDDLRWHDGQAVLVGRLCGVSQALGTKGSFRPAPHGTHCEDRARGQEDIRA